MRRRRPWLACTAIISITLLTAACRGGSGGSPTLASDPLAGMEPEIRNAIETRTDLGLRADEAWVREVAARPDAVTDVLDIPLTPQEAREISDRFARSDEAATIATDYGSKYPQEFAGLYIDQRHGGRIVVHFTARQAVHQAALDELWGAPGFIVVESARFTDAQLRDVQRRITDASHELAAQGIDLISVGSGSFDNVVDVVAKSDNPDATAVLTAFGPPGSIEVELYPADGPWANVASGPGWRLLGSFPTDHPYEVGVAQTRDQLADQLRRFEIEERLPNWDPASEIVVFFSDGIGSSCPEVRLDAVNIDLEDRIVHPTLSDPLEPRACTADLAGGVTFVVAISRDALPAPTFTVILKPELPHLGQQPVTLE